VYVNLILKQMWPGLVLFWVWYGD